MEVGKCSSRSGWRARRHQSGAVGDGTEKVVSELCRKVLGSQVKSVFYVIGVSGKMAAQLRDALQSDQTSCIQILVSTL